MSGFPWIPSAAGSLQSQEIKGAIALLGTNKMVMAFPAGCYFSWAPLLWRFGFLQLYRLGEKREKNPERGS